MPARFRLSELIRSREGNCNDSRSDSSDAGCMANVVERSLTALNDAIHWLLEVGSVRFCVERYIFYKLVNPSARWAVHEEMGCAGNAESGSATESTPSLADISATVSRARYLNCKCTSVPRIGYTPAHRTRRWMRTLAAMRTSTVFKYDIRYCNDECKSV